METEKFNKSGLLSEINDTVSELLILMNTLNESQVNIVPYSNSWTAGQLLRHVSKSISGMGQAMSAKSKPADRDPGEKIAGLKQTFLDFSIKMQSPEFIVPENITYEKQSLKEELNKAFTQFKNNTISATLTDLVEGLPLGEVTKLEILHFTLYHTQRHLYQMHNICKALRTPDL